MRTPAGSAAEWTRHIAFAAVAAVASLALGPAAADAASPVTVTNSCSPAGITLVNTTSCTATFHNNGAVDAATVNLSVAGEGLRFSNASPPATATDTGVSWSGPLAGTGFNVTSVAPGSVPRGYTALAPFGVAPLAGVTDDSIVNVSLPRFYYGGIAYTSLGVVSNGYVIPGGGSAAEGDVRTVPQQLPDPARPNNVLAPFWTDLIPDATGAVRTAQVTITGSNITWIVTDWANMKNFTASDPNRHSFEVWIREEGGAAGVGPQSEQIWFAYGTSTPANAPGNASGGSNWGAENNNGTSGVDLASQPADRSNYVVQTGPAGPGESRTFTYELSAPAIGDFASTATVSSNISGETASAAQPISVSTGKASLTIVPATLAQRSDGTPRAVTVTTDPPGLDGVSVTYDGSPDPPSVPGRYAVAASLNHPTYEAPEAFGTLEITDGIAPDTTVDKAPKKRTHKHKAKLRFSSGEAGATFECMLDGAAFAPCVSPAKYKKLDDGRHAFAVRATDAAGNVDASPATAGWKIK